VYKLLHLKRIKVKYIWSWLAILLSCRIILRGEQRAATYVGANCVVTGKFDDKAAKINIS
jgi:hypothetical protein